MPPELCLSRSRFSSDRDIDAWYLYAYWRLGKLGRVKRCNWMEEALRVCQLCYLALMCSNTSGYYEYKCATVIYWKSAAVSARIASVRPCSGRNWLLLPPQQLQCTNNYADT